MAIPAFNVLDRWNLSSLAKLLICRVLNDFMNLIWFDYSRLDYYEFDYILTYLYLFFQLISIN